jgi:hypothetical protein
MDDSAIEVSYVLTADDIVAYQAYYVANSSTLQTRTALRRKLLANALVLPPFGALAFLGGGVVFMAIRRGCSPRPSPEAC